MAKKKDDNMKKGDKREWPDGLPKLPRRKGRDKNKPKDS